MAEITDKKDINYALRLPPELYNKLVKIAASEHRSLNGQIVYLLEKSLK